MAKRYSAVAFRRAYSTRVASVLRDAKAEPLDAACVTDAVADTRAMALVLRDPVAALVAGALPADALIATAPWWPAGEEEPRDKPEAPRTWGIFAPERNRPCTG